MLQSTEKKKSLTYDELTLRRLVISAAMMYAWILIWALVLKLGDEGMLVNNYENLIELTAKERLEWDLIPFNYRGDRGYKSKLALDTVLNCFVFVPFGIMSGYVFKKKNIFRDAALCFFFAVFIELMQFVTMLGNPATEDLITNPAGYFIGLGAYRLIFKRLSTKQSIKVFAATNVVFGVTVIVSFVTLINNAELIFQILTKAL